MFKTFKKHAIKFSTRSPYIWNIAWKCANTFPFLLPHDNSYWALKYFCNQESGVFLDVGANTGISALSFRKINKSIPIVSIEPNPIHKQTLLKLTRKISSFSFLLLGLGDTQNELTFYAPKYKKINLHTFTSTSKEQIYDAIQMTFGEKIVKHLQIEKITSKIVTLDELNLNPSIIKIDTEGYDYQVLLGAQKTIQNKRPFFMIEACWSSYQNIETFFQSNHYHLFNYDHSKNCFLPIESTRLDNQLENKNIFAIPREKLEFIPIQSNKK